MDKNAAVGRILSLPLNKLKISPLNVRAKDKSDVSELAALIRAQGQLQNLIVIEGGPNEGVVAGGRRTRAMNLLVEQGHWTPEHDVLCMVADEENALAMSAAENSGREPMHPAEEFEAFKALVGQGTSIEDVAAQFGVSPLVVRRRLTLAKVSPMLIDAYKAGEMNLETLQAYALTDSHKLQESVFKSGVRQAWYVRQNLMKGKTDVAHDRYAHFVGLDAYEQAGGGVVRDLFGGPNSGYISDTALMQKLAGEKLEAIAEQLRGEGWSFVKVVPDLSWNVTHAYGRSKATLRELTNAEQAEISKLEAAIEIEEKRLEADNEDEDGGHLIEGERDVIDQAIARMQARINDIRALVQTWSDRQKKKAGVVLGLDHSGALEIHRGMIAPVDPKVAKQKELEKAKAAAKEAGEPEPTGFSEALVRKLTANRTAAMAAHLLECPRVALDLLCAQLATKIFYKGGYYGAGGVMITPYEQMGDLSRAADDVEQSKAWAAIEEKREQWRLELPENPAELFAWLGEQNIMQVVELLCFCTAVSLNAITSSETARPLEHVEQTIGLNMADWWQPTRATFLNQVPKAVIMGALADVGIGEVARADREKLKKGELAESAEELLHDSGWLPAPLRGKAAPIVAEARKPKAKAAGKNATENATKPAKNAPEAPKNEAVAPKNATRRLRKGEKANVPPSESPAEEFNRLHPASAWPFPTGRDH